MGKLLSLEIGGHERKPGWINADLYPGPNVDLVFDATKSWPIEDNSIGAIAAIHVVEHLPEMFGFMKEAWRVLVPSPMQNLFLRLPHGSSAAAFADPTHLRAYQPGSFAAFQPGYGEFIGNPQYAWQYPFEVLYVHERVSKPFAWLMRPFLRKFAPPILEHTWNGYCELFVGMRKMLPGEKLQHPANSVPVSLCMYGSDYNGSEGIITF